MSRTPTSPLNEKNVELQLASADGNPSLASFGLSFQREPNIPARIETSFEPWAIQRKIHSVSPSTLDLRHIFQKFDFAIHKSSTSAWSQCSQLLRTRSLPSVFIVP
ncbi:hypothetical protein E1B28_007961 [Marasmius oreades]|uniref:Uncharacterized protein n=1 Tax=Marasmius oreades TaxID=181124 RepID=A0A9P7S3D1_9AGAR|nr:uncharacterized protein E1B28_007961 [Marasmius oreades]KAG7094360.1 hypothetical protein E1B28_007961 [Marasmius oreades]